MPPCRGRLPTGVRQRTALQHLIAWGRRLNLAAQPCKARECRSTNDKAVLVTTWNKPDEERVQTGPDRARPIYVPDAMCVVVLDARSGEGSETVRGGNAYGIGYPLDDKRTGCQSTALPARRSALRCSIWPTSYHFSTLLQGCGTECEHAPMLSCSPCMPGSSRDTCLDHSR